MKKFLFFAACTLAFATSGLAQKGNNQVGIAVDLGLPIGSFGDAYKLGIGGQLRGLYGVGKAGQATLTTGYTSFKGKGSLYGNQKFSILPILLGYRQHFTALYVEPQLGVSTLTTKVPNFKYSETKFTYVVGVGYTMNGVDIGVRYQSAAELGQFAFHLGYNIPLGGKK